MHFEEIADGDERHNSIMDNPAVCQIHSRHFGIRQHLVSYEQKKYD
jgi:hypothetical protein